MVLSAATEAARAGEANACVLALPPRAALDYSISLFPAPGTPPEILQAGVELWSACLGSDDAVPRFELGPGGRRALTVEWNAGSSGARYCGRVEGLRIRLFAVAMAANGAPVRCDPPALTLAHELGHVLGLDDAPPRWECRAHVMAQASGIDRAVQRDECRSAAERWRSGEALFLASQPPLAPMDWNPPRGGRETIAAGPRRP